jgi:F0F1-type ATP synthase assembly protein I
VVVWPAEALATIAVSAVVSLAFLSGILVGYFIGH